MSIRLRNCYTFFLFFALQSTLLAQKEHQWLREGDRLYDKKEIQQSEEAYRKAGDNNPKALYNRGNTLYLQGKFPEAAEAFQQAAERMKSPQEKADALYNLGNAQMQQHSFKQAIESYENSLRLKPGDAQTKKNLQIARQYLKAQEQQQGKQQQQNQQQQQEQNQEPQQGQNNNSGDQDKEQPRSTPETPGSEQSKQQPGNSSQQAPQNKGAQSMDEARRAMEKTIDREDAASARKYREYDKNPLQPRKKKDW